MLPAFWELSTERQCGFGEGPIPWSAIDRYAARHGLESDVRRLVQLIQAMDTAYLEIRAAERETEKAQRPEPPSPREAVKRALLGQK